MDPSTLPGSARLSSVGPPAPTGPLLGGCQNSDPRTHGPIPLASTETHQNLASKIFCSCCRYCEDTQASDDSKVPSQTQENQPSTVDLKLQKSELNRQNSKRMSTSLSLGKLLLYPQKKSSSSSTEFEELNAQDHQKGFYKRNLNRYSHEQWPYQSCLIGRP
ncbi:testis expressed 48 [Ictidomys tridecemlineatus]|nr:testis expressed 48 [Ictidomys tridecemlineatus]